MSLFAQNKVNAIVGKADSSFLNDYVSKNWTTEDGLPGMTVNGLMQDKKGYVYICSYDGLVRFDGVEFAVFNRAVDEKYDFASARSIIQDSSGNIWVGHNDEGVSCLKTNGEIVKYTIANGLPNNKVNSLCEDFEHNIWIGTACGLCYITPENAMGNKRKILLRRQCPGGSAAFRFPSGAYSVFTQEEHYTLLFAAS